MNLQWMSNSQLVTSAKESVKKEQEATTSVLHHIKEVYRRRLFADDKCGSISEWVEKVLGYPTDQAWRRVSAAHALAELPELEAKLESGELNLTHLRMARRHFGQEAKAKNPLSREEKLAVFDELARTPTRTAEKLLLSKSSVPQQIKEHVKQVTPQLTEIKFYADENLLRQIEKLKGLLAHRFPQLSMAELIQKLCELGTAEWDPAQKKVRERSTRPRSPSTSRQSNLQSKTNTSTLSDTNRETNSPTKTAVPKLRSEAFTLALSKTAALQVVSSPQVAAQSFISGQASSMQKQAPSKPAYIPAATRRWVFKKAESRCENCGSTRFLEVDHKIPKAKNGNSQPENLRLLCRNCNQRAAIVQYGQTKMQKYLS